MKEIAKVCGMVLGLATPLACSGRVAPDEEPLIPCTTASACSDKVAPHEGPSEPLDCTLEMDHPTHLACTGLYSSWPAKEIASDAVPYRPGYRAWNDGMESRRFIAMPRRAQIDTTNPDEWVFPIGTRAWQELRHGARRLETRFAWKRADGTWLLTTYRWSPDGEATATELTTGERGVEGTAYEIPSQAACTSCHGGRKDTLLGFDALSLAAPGATGLTLQELEARGLLTQPQASPPVVPSSNATAATALGWLHANCGTSCHNDSPGARARGTGLNLRLEVATVQGCVEGSNAYQTAVNVSSGFHAPDGANTRIVPGNSTKSTLVFRASHFDTSGRFQMPPLAVHTVDDAAVGTLRAWIDAMPRQ